MTKKYLRVLRGRDEGKREFICVRAHVQISRYSKYDGRAGSQIRRNELPCAKSPIVRDLIGDCRELLVFKPRVFDTRVARNIVI